MIDRRLLSGLIIRVSFMTDMELNRRYGSGFVVLIFTVDQYPSPNQKV